MIQKYIKGRISVFIDAANLENSLKDLKWKLDYKKLYNYFFKNSKVFQIRFYCVRLDKKDQDNFFSFLSNTGFKLITKPLKSIQIKEDKIYRHIRKANFDVELALDAYILKDRYDTIVLFSGDSDFKYLVEVLKKENKKVIVVSSRYHISRELIEVAHKYIDIKKMRKEWERILK